MTTETTRTLALDIDGAVLEESKPIDWNDPMDLLRRTLPYPEAVRRILAAEDEGIRVVFVCNRRPIHGDVTARQLVKALSGWRPSRKLYLSPDIIFDDKELVGNKTDTLHMLQPDVYVGDLDGDRLAAELAGVPFMLAKDWRAGASYPWERPGAIKRRVAVSPSGRQALAALPHMAHTEGSS